MLILENKEYITSILKENSNNDYIGYLERIYTYLTTESINEELDLLLSKINLPLKDIEKSEQLFHVISFIINEIYLNDILENIDSTDLEDINTFLHSNFKEIFKEYYIKNGFICDKDYNDCVLSLYNNFSLELEVCDILLGKYLETFVIQ